MSGGLHRETRPATAGGFVDVLRVRLFALLFTAEVQSLVGDQLARIALALLVFERTESVTATAAVFALTLLPALFGGLVLSGIGDRFSRGAVMVTCDLVRATGFAAMALPGLPLLVVVLLLIGPVTLGPVFQASAVSLLSSRLTDGQFRSANGLRMVAAQSAQVLGLGIGGVLVTAFGAREALAIDALTFLLSAALISLATRNEVGRTASVASVDGSGAASDGDGRVVAATSRRRAVGHVLRDSRIRGLLALALLAGLFVVPEALGVPYGDAVGASTAQIGFLLAAIPLGSVIGASLIWRFRWSRSRDRGTAWLAVACGVPLLVSAAEPPWPVTAGCWLLSGVFGAYMVDVITSLVQSVPDAVRAQVVGVFSSLLLVAQGCGPLLFGALTAWMSVGMAVAVAGAVGSAVALAVAAVSLRPAASDAAVAALSPNDRSGAAA